MDFEDAVVATIPYFIGQAPRLPLLIHRKPVYPMDTSKSEQSNEIVPLAILPVLIQGPMGEEMDNAFLDSGSNTTLVDSALLTRMGLNGSSPRLSVIMFNGTVEIRSRYVSFEVEPLNCKEIIGVD